MSQSHCSQSHTDNQEEKKNAPDNMRATVLTSIEGNSSALLQQAPPPTRVGSSDRHIDGLLNTID